MLTGRQHPPYGSVASKSVSLSILNPNADGEQWLPANFTVIDPGNDADIVVLALAEPLLKNPLPSESADSSGATLGGDCEFLGFPYGGGWRANFGGGKSQWMPFVKHCTVAAFTTDGKKIWVLDGINNHGFSGGPVIFGTGTQQKILGVVSGYATEPAEVVYEESGTTSSKDIPPAIHEKGKVDVNSGFMIAFDISYAIDAIHRHPIGPLRTIK